MKVYVHVDSPVVEKHTRSMKKVGKYCYFAIRELVWEAAWRNALRLSQYIGWDLEFPGILVLLADMN